MNTQNNQTTNYKPTDIPWLGDIPGEWEVKKVKFIFDLVQNPVIFENQIILSLTLHGLKVRDITNNEGQLPASFNGYNFLEVGDIVFNPMDLKRGYVDSAKISGIISPAYTTLRKKTEINERYYEYYFQWHYNDTIFYHMGRGVSEIHRWTLGDNTLLNYKTPLPPLTTQSAIVTYLDTKCELIAKYITDKSKIIELLKEQKKSLIYNAVTGKTTVEATTVSPLSNKLKSSGVEWLRDIPIDWEVRRLGKLWKYCNRGQTPDYSENENDLCVINQSCVTYDGIKLSKAKFDKSSIYETSKGKIQKDDLLFNSTGTGTLGRVCLFDLDLKCICDSHVTILRVNPDFVLAKFLNYFFKDQQDFVVNLLSEGATNQIELRSDWLKSLQIPLPPLETQQQIVAYLDTQTAIIDDTIANISREIELIQEYKKSLIYQSVTGKIIIT